MLVLSNLLIMHCPYTVKKDAAEKCLYKIHQLGNTEKRVQEAIPTKTSLCQCNPVHVHTKPTKTGGKKKKKKRGNVRGAGVQAVVKRKNYSSPLFIKTQRGISCQAQKTVSGGIQGVTLHPSAFSHLSLLPPSYFNLLSGAVPAGFNWKCPAVFSEMTPEVLHRAPQ